MAIETYHSQSGRPIKWIDAANPSERELIEISEQFQLPKSVVQDCLDPDHLPKHEKLGNANFIIIRIFSGDVKQHPHSIQELTAKIAMFLSKDFLITIHRFSESLIEPVQQQRIVNGFEETVHNLAGRIILYGLKTFEEPAIRLDSQVDVYETTILRKHTKSILLEGLYYIKRKANVARKMLVLSREVLSYLRTSDIDKSIMQEIEDLHNKLIILYEEIIEDINNLTSTFLSLSTNKTNAVMKVLTLFSVFFLPLTFIVGVYGMNFRYMPEIDSRWGYPAVWVVMVLVTLVIFGIFRRKKWL